MSRPTDEEVARWADEADAMRSAATRGPWAIDAHRDPAGLVEVGDGLVSTPGGLRAGDAAICAAAPTLAARVSILAAEVQRLRAELARLMPPDDGR